MQLIEYGRSHAPNALTAASIYGLKVKIPMQIVQHKNQISTKLLNLDVF